VERWGMGSFWSEHEGDKLIKLTSKKKQKQKQKQQTNKETNK